MFYYTPSDVEDLETLAEGQADDLKFEYEDEDGFACRLWLCRVTDTLSIEKCFNGAWREVVSNVYEVELPCEIY